MAEKAPRGLQTDSGLEESGSTRVLLVIRVPTHTLSVSPLPGRSHKGGFTLPLPPILKWRGIQNQNSNLKSPRSLFRGCTVGNWSNEPWMKQGKKFTALKKKKLTLQGKYHAFSLYILFPVEVNRRNSGCSYWNPSSPFWFPWASSLDERQVIVSVVTIVIFWEILDSALDTFGS